MVEVIVSDFDEDRKMNSKWDRLLTNVEDYIAHNDTEEVYPSLLRRLNRSFLFWEGDVLFNDEKFHMKKPAQKFGGVRQIAYMMDFDSMINLPIMETSLQQQPEITKFFEHMLKYESCVEDICGKLYAEYEQRMQYCRERKMTFAIYVPLIPFISLQMEDDKRGYWYMGFHGKYATF